MLGKAGMTSEKLLKAARKVKETFGTDPKDPWSAKAGIQESSIDNYLLAKGQNPKYVDQQKKAALARSHEYQNWASTRTKQEEVEIRDLDEEVTDETHPWEVYHRQQQRVVGRYKTRAAASRAQDRHDNAYGGYITTARNVNDRKKTNEGKDPNMDAGCGSQSVFVSNANTTNSPSDKKLNTKLKKEEVEELDELSKKTLGSYVTSASRSAADTAHGIAHVSARKYTGKNSDIMRDLQKKSVHRMATTLNKRQQGIEKAVSKLAKEEIESIDESDVKHNGKIIGYVSKHDEGGWEGVHHGDDDAVGVRYKYFHHPEATKSEIINAIKKHHEKHIQKMQKESNYEWSGAGGMYETDAVKQHYSLIDKYLMSKGINPKYVDQQKKAAEARTDAFRKWKEHALQTQKESVLHDEPEGTLTRVSERSRAFKLIKSIVKGHKKSMSEEMYDKDKEEKDPARVYGKAPKLEKPDDKEKSKSENKPQAAATLSGGRTLTGQDRDVVELDPMMRNRPGQPDITKGKDKDKDKDKKDDKKSDKK